MSSATSAAFIRAQSTPSRSISSGSESHTGSDSESDPDSEGKDGNYFEPIGGKRPRASYKTSFPVLEKRQNMTQLADKTYRYDSAFSPGHNFLDSEKREQVGSEWKKPAMDHYPHQYALLEHAYDALVTYERTRGPTRRLSIDLATGVSSAIANPDNLRIVSHAEHVAHGNGQHKDQFTDAQMVAATAYIEKHMPDPPQRRRPPLGPAEVAHPSTSRHGSVAPPEYALAHCPGGGCRGRRAVHTPRLVRKGRRRPPAGRARPGSPGWPLAGPSAPA